MSARNIILIVAALLITAGTTVVARSWLAAQRAKPVAASQQAPEPEGVKVLVAKVPLATGTFVQEDQLRWQLWPGDDIPESYLTEDEIQPEELYGAVVRRGFNIGEPIIAKRVMRPGDRGFLAVVLRPGFRAIAIRVNATSGVSGLVFPGDRIDIILTHTITVKSSEEAIERRASETILENVRVLAIDQTVDENTAEPTYASNFTLEVTPKQAELLSVVREIGSLSLRLRSLATKADEHARPPNQERTAKERSEEH